MLPPGGLIEIVFSFDTTGSMGSVIKDVKKYIQDMVQRLQADIEGIKIAIIAHGDYCDVDTYITKYIDFTTDVKKLSNFVSRTGQTGGGDSEECYELALRKVRTELSWTPGSKRSLVIIGDYNPHEPDYEDNVDNIDWREEATLLSGMDVKIYSIQCLDNEDADDFYETIATTTGGHHLKLDEFSNVFDFLMAVAYREHGEDLFQGYENEVRNRSNKKAINKDLEGLFTTLRKESVDKPTSSKATKSKTRISGTKSSKEKSTRIDSRKVAKIGIATTSRTIKKRTPVKAKTKHLITYLRELIQENTFSLKDKNWSAWQLILTSNKSYSKKMDWYQYNSFYVKKNIKIQQENKPSLFELAVQIQPGHKRHVVYNHLSRCVTGKTWERRLFAQKNIRRQVDKVAKRGYAFYLRRLPLTNIRMERNIVDMLQKYDYAWKKVRNKRSCHRYVEVEGDHIISDNSL